MIVKEYRVVNNCTLEEYKIAQLYAVAEVSKAETGGGEGVEVVANEPYEDEQNGSGQYTHKIYHLSSKVPSIVRMLVPAGALILHEKSWNAYPHCKTVLTSEWMKNDFSLITETMHVDNDRGNLENAVNCDADRLKVRQVIHVDIANDPVDNKDYKESEDPKLVKSAKTDRGPLIDNWIETCEPVMCAYKLVTVEFKWFGLQGKIESFIQKTMNKMIIKFHRQLFGWVDNWVDMDMDDIRQLEDKTKQELDEKRRGQEVEEEGEAGQ